MPVALTVPAAALGAALWAPGCGGQAVTVSGHDEASTGGNVGEGGGQGTGLPGSSSSSGSGGSTSSGAGSTTDGHTPGRTWAYVYENGGTIFGVPFGGSTSTVVATGGNLGPQVTFDTARIYTTSESTGDAGLPLYSIDSLPLAGGPLSSLEANVPWPIAITAMASNGTTLYVAKQENTLLDGGYTSVHGVIEAIPSTGGAPVLVQSVAAELGGVAADQHYVYWTQTYDGSDGGPGSVSGSVHRALLAGGADETLASGQLDPIQVAVDSSGIYWLNVGTPGRDCTSTDGSVLRLPPGATTPVTVATGLQGPSSLAVGGGNAYFATLGAYCNSSGAGLGSVHKVAASGQATTVASGLTTPQNLYADGTYLYFTTVVDAYNGVLGVTVTPR